MAVTTSIQSSEAVDSMGSLFFVLSGLWGFASGDEAGDT